MKSIVRSRPKKRTNPQMLVNYVAELNRQTTHQIKLKYNRQPLVGELLDLTILAHRMRIRDNLEYDLEDENLFQDGELSRKEAEAREKQLFMILDTLESIK